VRNNDLQLIKILKSSIYKETIIFDNYYDVQWESLIEGARDHEVSSLVYSVLDKKQLSKCIEKNKLDSWKREVFYSGINQINHINTVEKVLKEFSSNSIPVIVLKGLVVREFYSIPELRTMSDADLLVHREDLSKIKDMMISIGYKQIKSEENHGAHVVYMKDNTFVEVHWTLINDHFFKGGKSFEEELWNNAIEVKVGGVYALSLCLEDIALHLCIHMAVHLANRGFGIRQIVDLVLLVERKGEMINWDSFIEKTKDAGIHKFTIVIFNLCNNLFNMEVPKGIRKVNRIESKYLKKLINEIFASGVHGIKDESRVFANEFAYDQNKGATDGSRSIIKKFIKLMFPSVKVMDHRYGYAKRIKILIPIAWIHRLIVGVFNKDYSLVNKIKMAIFTIFLANKRSKLLRALDL
jgi:hypothetical protein